MNRRREKLINAIIYFVQNTNNCGLTKLMKLLNKFEFQIFNQTGTPPIGLKYYAWERGPVAKDLWEDIVDDRAQDISDTFSVAFRKTPDYDFYKINVRDGHEFNDFIFTPRELRVMQEIANECCNKSAGELTRESHQMGTPWERTVAEKGDKAEINYLYALDNEALISEEEAINRLQDFIEVGKLFQIEA